MGQGDDRPDDEGDRDRHRKQHQDGDSDDAYPHPGLSNGVLQFTNVRLAPTLLRENDKSSALYVLMPMRV